MLWPTRPTLLLADEPTGALDSEGGMEVLELFRRLHAGGQAILLVTHDEAVAHPATRIVRVRDGRVEDDGRASASASAPDAEPVTRMTQAELLPTRQEPVDTRQEPVDTRREPAHG